MSVGESWQQRYAACIDQARAGWNAAAAASDPLPVHQYFGAASTVHQTSRRSLDLRQRRLYDIFERSYVAVNCNFVFRGESYSECVKATAPWLLIVSL
jgi:hypothetical protein